MLLLALCFSGLLPLCAVPTRAQEVASVGNLGQLREQYNQLLAIERDPKTTTEVREVNHTFLEERRAQLVSALRERIGALRKYEETISASLGDGERRALADSIRRLAQELETLQPAQAQAPPLTPAARPARRPSRATRTAPTVTATAALASAAEPRRAEPQDPSPSPTPTPEPPKKDDPITITSPAEDKTVGVSEVELEVSVKDKKINDLFVEVYTPASEKPKTARTYEVLRSDEDKKTIVVALSKGENRVVVSDLKRREEVKAERKLTFTPPTEPPLGRAGASGGGGTARSTTLSATTERWTNVPESGSDVRVGYTGDPGKSYQFYVKKRSGGAPQNIDSTMTPGISGVVSAVFPELSAGDMVGIVQMDGGNPVDGSRDEIAVESALDETKGGPFGLLLGGVVMSQQAQEFQQADPFFGFTAGYVSKMRNAYKLSKKGTCGNETARYIETNVRGLFATEDGLVVRCANNRWAVSSDRKITEENANARFARNGGFNGWRWNLRFQGLFQSDPRKATATDTTETGDDDDGGNGTTDNPFTFIASRKTFNIETQLWLDFWANSAFSIGPYAAIGASTVLDKNELQGEAVTDGEEGTEGDNTSTVATQSQSDNDIKKYYEGGVLMNINLNRDLFLQSILAYRHDEALAGLYNGPPSCKFCDTQHRFSGKLRIFPAGLSRGFGRQIRMTPMFGVEVNAGRGPDHIKFFSGFAMRIKGININDAGAKLADTTPSTTDGSSNNNNQ
jgi:hypothetical protein